MRTGNERIANAVHELFADSLEQDECDELIMAYRRCRDSGWPEAKTRKICTEGVSTAETWDTLQDQRCERHEIFNRACEKMTGKPMPHDACYGCYVEARERLYEI